MADIKNIYCYIIFLVILVIRYIILIFSWYFTVTKRENNLVAVWLFWLQENRSKDSVFMFA